MEEVLRVTSKEEAALQQQEQERLRQQRQNVVAFVAAQAAQSQETETQEAETPEAETPETEIEAEHERLRQQRENVAAAVTRVVLVQLLATHTSSSAQCTAQRSSSPLRERPREERTKRSFQQT